MAKVSTNKRARQTQKVKRAVQHGSANGRKARVGQFFAASTLEELAEAQGVGPLKDPEDMAGAWPEGEDVDEFLKETYEGRG
jgi:hypothetical protein